MRVVVLSRRQLGKAEMDAVEYLKRYGEHLLATKVVAWRRGKESLADFIFDLRAVVAGNEDSLDEG